MATSLQGSLLSSAHFQLAGGHIAQCERCDAHTGTAIAPAFCGRKGRGSGRVLQRLEIRQAHSLHILGQKQCLRVRQRRVGIQASANATEISKQVEVPAGSVSVVLLAGGVGKRMGAAMPKQYLPVRGQAIALYSLALFASLEEVGEIIVVCDPSYQQLFQDALRDSERTLRWASPGKERQDSVFNGLQEIRPSAQLVCVHDSARPLLTRKDTLAVFRDALQHGAAVLGVPVKPTIKEVKAGGFVARTLDRSKLWEMQTPQVIQPDLLRRGFEHVTRERLEVTDDVSIVEYLNAPVKITQGSYTNLKVTTPEDLLLADRLLAEAAETQAAEKQDQAPPSQARERTSNELPGVLSPVTAA